MINLDCWIPDYTVLLWVWGGWAIAMTALALIFRVVQRDVLCEGCCLMLIGLSVAAWVFDLHVPIWASLAGLDIGGFILVWLELELRNAERSTEGGSA